MSLIKQIDRDRLPQHVAIIMDGNGRWAKSRGLERYMGHQEGVVSVRKVVEAAKTIGVKYLTMYTFSTENWNRPEAEVHALMSLMVAAIKRETPDLMKNKDWYSFLTLSITWSFGPRCQPCNNIRNM